jgi:hypothetical protein
MPMGGISAIVGCSWWSNFIYGEILTITIRFASNIPAITDAVG